MISGNEVKEVIDCPKVKEPHKSQKSHASTMLPFRCEACRLIDSFMYHITHKTSNNDATLLCNTVGTGSTKRLRMVTSDSECKPIDPDTKGSEKGLKGHAPGFPIDNSLSRLTQIRTI